MLVSEFAPPAPAPDHCRFVSWLGTVLWKLLQLLFQMKQWVVEVSYICYKFLASFLHKLVFLTLNGLLADRVDYFLTESAHYRLDQHVLLRRNPMDDVHLMSRVLIESYQGALEVVVDNDLA